MQRIPFHHSQAAMHSTTRLKFGDAVCNLAVWLLASAVCNPARRPPWRDSEWCGSAYSLLRIASGRGIRHNANSTVLRNKVTRNKTLTPDAAHPNSESGCEAYSWCGPRARPRARLDGSKVRLCPRGYKNDSVTSFPRCDFVQGVIRTTPSRPFYHP